MRHKMNRIHRKDHNIGAYRTNYISLPFCNNKKYMLKDGYSRLPYFYEPSL